MKRVTVVDRPVKPARLPEVIAPGLPVPGLSEGLFGSVPSRSQHAYFSPVHYAAGYAYPLIVWLHSPGDDVSELQRVMPMISHRNLCGVAVQARQGSVDSGYFWDHSAESTDAVTHDVMHAIDVAGLKMNIHSGRIFLAGSGAGGAMAFAVGMKIARRLAGVVSINGPFQCDPASLARWRECRELPLLWLHGRDSRNFSEELLCQQLRQLHVAGFEIQLRQYASDEDLPPRAFADVNQWIMERIPTSVK